MCDCINETKNIVKKQIDEQKVTMFGIPFSEYQKVYASTNENIYGYMSKLDFNGKNNALSVMASGDHAFNAALYGIKEIDTFDTNKLTIYYSLGIKRSAILKYNYKDYLSFLKKNHYSR